MLGGLLIWAVHFFGGYLLAEFYPSVALIFALSVLCLLGIVALLYRQNQLAPRPGFEAWHKSVALGCSGLSLVGVAWQTMVLLVR